MRQCLCETGPAVPWRGPALGTVAGFGQIQEGKGTRGSGLFTDERGERIRAVSSIPPPRSSAQPIRASWCIDCHARVHT